MLIGSSKAIENLNAEIKYLNASSFSSLSAASSPHIKKIQCLVLKDSCSTVSFCSANWFFKVSSSWIFCFISMALNICHPSTMVVRIASKATITPTKESRLTTEKPPVLQHHNIINTIDNANPAYPQRLLNVLFLIDFFYKCNVLFVLDGVIGDGSFRLLFELRVECI